MMTGFAAAVTVQSLLHSCIPRCAAGACSVAVEPCHSGVSGFELATPDVLMTTAANPTENSLGVNVGPDIEEWVADQFAFRRRPHLTLRGRRRWNHEGQHPGMDRGRLSWMVEAVGVEPVESSQERFA